jgi:hypothetical protein
MDACPGTVCALWRWPVKSMGGEPMPSVRVDGRGVGGDRTHAVLRRGYGPVGAPERARLAAWTATYPFNIGANVEPGSPPFALVTSPADQVFVWGDPRLRCALEAEIGPGLQLVRELDGTHEAPRTVLVTWGDDDPEALRANVHLDLDLDPGSERAILTFEHGVRLRLLRHCDAGGMYARVISNGRMALGESVAVSAPERPLAGVASGSGASGR